jgi:hypothetical protein
MYLHKVIRRKLGEKLFFGIMKATDEKCRLRIRKLVVRNRGSGSGSVPNVKDPNTENNIQ